MNCSGEVDKCIGCGTCINNCPIVIHAGSSIFPGPRYFIEALRANHEIECTRDVAYFCTTCMKCAEVCPSRLDVTKIMVHVKGEIFEESELTSGHKKLLHNIKTTKCAVEPREKTHHLQPGVKKADTVYFPGCIASERLPETIEGADKILKHLRVQYAVPDGLACCGSPLKRTGATEIADSLRDHNIKIFQDMGAKEIVASCPGCASHLKENYKEFEVYHIVEYISKRFDPHKLKFEDGMQTKATLHYPCHMYRGLGPYTIDYAEAIIGEIPNVKYVEMEDADMCCGAGGGVLSGAPELAEALRGAKLQRAMETSADILLAPCPLCTLNLRMASNEMKVKELSSFIAERLSEI